MLRGLAADSSPAFGMKAERGGALESEGKSIAHSVVMTGIAPSPLWDAAAGESHYTANQLCQAGSARKNEAEYEFKYEFKGARFDIVFQSVATSTNSNLAPFCSFFLHQRARLWVRLWGSMAKWFTPEC